MSTDNTVKIAKDNGCEVVQFDTNNQIQDSKYLEIKNNCWRSAKTDWVLVCDMDELLNIDAQQLAAEEAKNVSIIRSEGYNMINMEDNYDLDNIKHGSRCEPYDKSYLFNKKNILSINYSLGCHTCSPVGLVKHSDTKYILYHYKCINPDFMASRYAEFAKRLSPQNIKNGWGSHYKDMTPELIKSNFNVWRGAAIKLID
jgi:hypothetical protein